MVVEGVATVFEVVTSVVGKQTVVSPGISADIHCESFL
jgi:hypothetical protein